MLPDTEGGHAQGLLPYRYRNGIQVPLEQIAGDANLERQVFTLCIEDCPYLLTALLHTVEVHQSFIHAFKRVLLRIRSQPRYVQTQPAVSRLVYLGQFCTSEQLSEQSGLCTQWTSMTLVGGL